MLAARSRRLSPNWLRTSPCASNARSSKLRKSRVMHLPTYRTHVRASASRCAGLTHVIEVSTATPTRDALRLAKSAIKAGLAAGGQVSGPPRLILLARGRVRAGRGVEGVEPDGRRRARRPRRRDARSDLGRPAAHPRGRRHRRDPARRHERARHGRRPEARSRAAATPACGTTTSCSPACSAGPTSRRSSWERRYGRTRRLMPCRSGTARNATSTFSNEPLQAPRRGTGRTAPVRLGARQPPHGAHSCDSPDVTLHSDMRKSYSDGCDQRINS